MFEIGREYHRQSEIHGKFGGQQRGGIASPKNFPYIFLFTSENGEEYGYHDRFQEEIFWYTGEGQVGDMKMIRGNKNIRDHVQNGKTIFLFQQTRKAYVSFVGTAEYLGHHSETRKDKNGADRSALIFHLDIDSSPDELGVQEESPQNYTLPDPKKFSKSPLHTFRKLALKPRAKDTSITERMYIARYRSAALKEYLLKRAKGKREGCGSEAPFLTKKGPFLECHHVFRLADGGPDHPQNVVALCPNCHRRAHYSKDGKAFNDLLVEIALEAEQLAQKGTDLFSGTD